MPSRGRFWVKMRPQGEWGILIVQGDHSITVYESPLHSFAQNCFNKVAMYDVGDAARHGCTLHEFANEVAHDYADRKEYEHMVYDIFNEFDHPMLRAAICARDYFKRKVAAKHRELRAEAVREGKWFNNGKKLSSLRPVE